MAMEGLEEVVSWTLCLLLLAQERSELQTPRVHPTSAWEGASGQPEAQGLSLGS